MTTKSSRKSKAGNTSLFKEENKGPYAVVVAELESAQFEPLTDQTPHCLLPLGNVPLLHYTLSRLFLDGFQDILIYACRHSGQIREYIRNTRCYLSRNVRVHSGEGSHSLGDVMRDLDASQLLRGVNDFLLIPADLICANPLLPLLREHEKRRQENPNSILSVVFSSIPHYLSPSQAAEWGVTVLYSPANANRLRKLFLTKYEPSPIINVSELMQSECTYQLASDLIDVGVIVCSNHIAPLFQDNFDHQTTSDLINDVLSNEEILGYSVNLDVLTTGPLLTRAAPDLQSLINFTPCLLSRLGGTANLIPPLMRTNRNEFCCIGPHMYVAKSAKIHHGARLVGACLIGPGCEIGNGACLIDSTLGSDCQVGEKAKLRRVIAQDGVFIGPNVCANTAWISSGARLLEGIKLPFACFVGHSETSTVTLGPGRGSLPTKAILVAPGDMDLVLEPDVGGSQVWAASYTKKYRPRSGGHTISIGSESDWDDNTPGAPCLVLPECVLWDTAEDRLRALVKQRRNKRLTSSTTDVGHTRLHSGKSNSVAKPSQSMLESGSDEDLSDVSGDEGEKSEAFLIGELLRTLQHGHENIVDSTENVILEVNSLKHAYNIPIDDLIFLLFKALLDLAKSKVSYANAGADDEKSRIRLFVAEVKNQLCKFENVFKSYLSGTNADGRLCLQAIEDSACYQPLVMSSGPFVFHAMYDKDLVTESAIWWWLENSPLLSDDEVGQHTKQLRQNLQPFLTWLKEAEEDDEEEEEDSDED